MSNTLEADDHPELFDKEVVADFINEVKAIEGPFALMKKFYSARRKHGELIGRPLAKELLEVSSQAIDGYLSRGRLTDVQIGPLKLVPVNEVLGIWKERYDNGKLVYDRNSKLGGKDGPLSNKEAFEMVTSLCMDEGFLAATDPLRDK